MTSAVRTHLATVEIVDGRTVADRDALLTALRLAPQPRRSRRTRLGKPAKRRKPTRLSGPHRPLHRRSDVQRTGQRLPDAFADTLQMLRRTADPRLDRVLRAAIEQGWTLRVLAKPLGVTPEAVRIRAVHALDRHVDIVVPSPPQRQPRPKPAPPPKLAEPVAARLRALWVQARQVNGATPADDPRRRASEEFTAAIAAIVTDDGISRAAVARALGLTPSALYLRLARHGYLPTPPSSPRYKGVPTWPRDHRSTQCRRGHPLDGDNLRITVPGGVRVCRACERIRSDRRQQRRRVKQAGDAA